MNMHQLQQYFYYTRDPCCTCEKLHISWPERTSCNQYGQQWKIRVKKHTI